MAKYANILETIGNTPVVKVGKLAPAGVDLFVKIEAFNLSESDSPPLAAYCPPLAAYCPPLAALSGGRRVQG